MQVYKLNCFRTKFMYGQVRQKSKCVNIVKSLIYFNKVLYIDKCTSALQHGTQVLITFLYI